ncbi:hypothetical protein ACFVAD_10245 [Sutcliffiella sp. NPDC057660]|uniref:hypothetical protein n=1 Tax=Sutcliffiella sp. NPDC057660 TaxID=3346199 RepID=UPI0036951F95
MTYRAKTQRGLLVSLLFFTLASWAWNFDTTNLFSFHIIILVFILVALGTSYELTVDKAVLTYQMLFLQTTIFKRTVNASQISQMKFKRYGWIQTGVAIRMKKGFTLRIVGFKPQHHLIRLEKFAEENGIPINETAGYIILKR